MGGRPFTPYGAGTGGMCGGYSEISQRNCLLRRDPRMVTVLDEEGGVQAGRRTLEVE